MTIRWLIPAGIRAASRRRFDAFFCRKLHGLEEIGAGSSWWVDVSSIEPGDVVVSGGVGSDVSFERDLAVRYGCRVLLFDPSPTGIATMARAENQIPGIEFFPVGLAGRIGEGIFSEPADPIEGSFRLAGEDAANTIRFHCEAVSEIVKHRAIERLAVLKLDIEGFEYAVLQDVLSAGIRFRQIAVEFHHFLPGIPRSRTLAAIGRLRAAGYRLVHKRQCDYLFVLPGNR